MAEFTIYGRNTRTAKKWNKLVEKYEKGKNLQLEEFATYELEKFTVFCKKLSRQNGKNRKLLKLWKILAKEIYVRLA